MALLSKMNYCNKKHILSDHEHTDQVAFSFIEVAIENGKVSLFKDFHLARAYFDQNNMKKNFSILNLFRMKS